MGRGAQRTKANNYNLLWLKQKELVCDESSALTAVAAVAARVPSPKLHIPFISMP